MSDGQGKGANGDHAQIPAFSPAQPVLPYAPTGYPPFYAYPPPPTDPHTHSPDPSAATGAPPGPYVMAFTPPGMLYAYPPQGAGYPTLSFPPGVQMHAPGMVRPKRKQVKMACTNCAAACKRCDEARPCERCLKYGIADTCADGVRKERKKGIKRGPYKRKGKMLNTDSGFEGFVADESGEWPEATGAGTAGYYPYPFYPPPLVAIGPDGTPMQPVHPVAPDANGSGQPGMPPHPPYYPVHPGMYPAFPPYGHAPGPYPPHMLANAMAMSPQHQAPQPDAHMDTSKVSAGSSRDDGILDTSSSDSAGPTKNSRKRGRANKDDDDYSPKARKRPTGKAGGAGTGAKRTARKTGQETGAGAGVTSTEVPQTVNPQTGLTESGSISGALTA